MRIRDIDPRPAPDHSADDRIRALKDFCEQTDRMNHGFTRTEVTIAARCDWKTLASLLEALVDNGHLVLDTSKKPYRYFPQDSLFTVKHAEVYGEAAFLAKTVKCRKNDCPYSLLDGECWILYCSICKNSHDHQPSEQGVWDRLYKNNCHRDRKAHSLEQIAGIG
jgi:hypothetical protein